MIRRPTQHDGYKKFPKYEIIFKGMVDSRIQQNIYYIKMKLMWNGDLITDLWSY